MSVYEFVCKECRKSFEVREDITRFNPRKVACPKCGSKNVERHWTPVNLETSKKS